MRFLKNNSNAEFETIVTQILEKTPISTNDNLLGFKLDIEAYLEQQEIFTNIKIDQKQDPRCALVTTCHISVPTLTKEDAARVLEMIWLQRIRYSSYESHFIDIQAGQLSLRFISLSRFYPLCVTGIITVTGFGS